MPVSFAHLPPALRPHRLRIVYVDVGADLRSVHTSDHALLTGASAAIGSFDGVHIGHQHVIESAIRQARLNGAPSAVIGFDPHPQSFFRPDGPPFRLMALSQQMRAFEALGVEIAYILHFDAQMAALEAEPFARRILRDHLRLSHVSAGFDFQFGRKGGGHAHDLEAFGARLGFTTDILPCQTDADGRKLSSSAVREALQAGDVTTATAILGRPQAFLGEVKHGAKLGRTLGFPTLNVALGDYLRPRYGIYVTRTRLSDGRVFNGVSNIGLRPTVGGDRELLEAYLFGFDEEIYGQMVETELLAFIRPEAKFDGLEALKTAIRGDEAAARAWFAKAG
ncbi:bifunctional riboflavin kinase/FAD synthetase [Asticcacaulis sp. EMRT-3]|uniref:bifunctional riboflavin kinase/FAD synthetase n=1 Tax=Asticcacaulis sp. EMRT-3 TaxID=3040349 RepID=UPI0024AFCDE6|nr:bifunctional riboflavin kinase/FAD synthetase [Asticcacaulis sp. EMRT-3]MDI7774911.1 bifunctional riboflavin kinase/FAD synthetase [Asticcacaulis sp. EMRT-3]